MSEDEYKLYEAGEHCWGMFVISDNVLEKLSELNCNEHKDDSDPLRQFFEHQIDETVPSIQNARCTVQPVKSIDTDENVSFAMMETDTICIDGDENKSIEGTVNLNTVEQKDIPDDQDTGGNSVQYEVPDLTCLLDEQAATVDQLSSASEQQLVSVLPVLSDAGLVHICALMCSVSASEQSKLGSLVCRLLLLPRLQGKGHEPCSRAVVNALVKFTKSLPHLSCAEVLLPLMLTSDAVDEKDAALQIISEGLGPQHKENLLRSFLQCKPEKLDEWKIPLLQELLLSPCDDTARQHLVQLLADSASDFSCNTRFAKLLISVIQQLGPGAPADVRQQLAELVGCNKSVLKRAAEKALHAF
ncbi:uncharacterized protein LOC110826512 [Zootermopsis nevadensis]|uniref:uncharacterized protein LOC110826512 n=1 Tax=Zootermopsis nevadensis TaxID=136037 RepID=UPI000B8E6884|nr:uncharacterized protein LOC110826512 [Zootermopsis nevadensis]